MVAFLVSQNSKLISYMAGGLVAIGQSIAMGGALPATGYIGAAGLASYFSGRLVQSSKPVVEAEDDHATRDSEAGEVKESGEC